MKEEVNTSRDGPVKKPHLRVSTICRRRIRIGLISISGIVVLIAIVVLPLASYWKQIALAAFVIIVGTAGSLLFEEWKERNWRKWLRAVFIGIVLVVGTLLTSHGWNMRDNYFRDRALLIAAATEWRINKTYIHVQSQRRDEFLTRGSNLSTALFVLPTARETRQVLTQATSFRDDTPLIHALTLYAIAADRLVASLEHIDRLCSQPIATMEMKKMVVERELGEGKDSSLQYFVKAHEQLENVLVSKYPWSLEEAETRVDKEFLNAIEGTRLNLPPDPNKPGRSGSGG